ncbi:MAG: carbohydrate porin [Sphingomonadales bacterium]|nr:carbohydrate porin [Sphingomonadales bacterium]
MKSIRLTVLACAALGHFAAYSVARADEANTGNDGLFTLRGQATFVVQGTPGFPSSYDGPNSLTPHQRKETIDATLYLGARLWRGAEFWVNPELDQGFGLSNTLGAAGFPSAEAYKVGKKSPYFRLQRAFVRQTIDLGGEQSIVEGVANQFAGTQTANHIILTVGKFGVGDVFDTNRYAHDPRGDFLNWSVVDAGTFDYAADAWGYSSGIAAEWAQGAWTFRAGVFNLSKVPNGETLETGFNQRQIDGEIEHRHKIAGHEGAVRVTVFRNSGRFGRFDDALALAGQTNTPPDTALVRSRKSRAGLHLNVEQAVSDDIGIFVRAGYADGSVEPYDFTDIDRTVELGAAVAGRRWGRATDTVGVVAVVNGISNEHQRYLAAGGIGVLVGDGELSHPGTEQIAEIYYRFKPVKVADLTLDYQHIANPGYNRDRGPADVFAIRIHGQF